MKCLLLAICILVTCCNQPSKNNDNLSPIRHFNADVEVKIHHTKGENYFCISLCNKTNRGIYIPDATLFERGLTIHIQKWCKNLDVSDEFKTLMIDGAYSIDYDKASKSCGCLPLKGYLGYAECDSLAPEIFAINKNLDKEKMFLTVSRALHDAVFLNPKECYNEMIPIPDSFLKKTLVVSFMYPYPYPTILTGKYSLSKGEVEYNKKMLDSLHYDYPQLLKGYKLCDSAIYSDTIIIK